MVYVIINQLCHLSRGMIEVAFLFVGSTFKISHHETNHNNRIHMLEYYYQCKCAGQFQYLF